MAWSAKAKQRRRKRLAQGLCGHCGLKPRFEDLKRCADCRDRDNAKHKDWMANAEATRAANGLCKSCGKRKIAAHSASRCELCLRDNRDRLKTPHHRKTARERAKVHYQRYRLIVIDHYTKGKRRCQCCGESHLWCLTIDHVNNDGAKHRKRYKVVGGMKLFRFIIDHGFPRTFQILCFNCNAGKAYYGKGICPHKLDKDVQDGKPTQLPIPTPQPPNPARSKLPKQK